LGRDIEEIRKEREEVNAEINKLRKDVTAKKRSLSESSAKRRELINSIKIKNAEANRYKARRDALNEKVKNYKKERDDLNAKVKKLVSEYKKLSKGAPKKDFKKLQALRDSLEWKLQTSVIEIKKEDELVSKIEKLNLELEEYKDLISLSSSIDELRTASKKVHNAIIEASKESQVYHEKFLESVKIIRQLESQIDTLNSERKVLSEEIDRGKARITELTQRAKELEHELKTIDTGSALRSEKELKEEAKEIYERFKRGEKLGLGDIYLLRRFDLV
jgi:uncharacterized coiled-coil DUF342 family protein